MSSLVKPNAWAIFRLPSESLRVIQAVPNTIISLGKYGSFQSNLVIGRPYNLTYELLDRQEGESHGGLRIVPASELHADTIAEEEASANATPDDKITSSGYGVEFEIVGETGEIRMRSNRDTVDDSTRQTLSMAEIEALKKDGTDAGKDLIAKLMLSHTALDEKTAFSLAKYKLLKTRKYLRRFTILPLDVPLLTQWLIEDKDPSRIMEMREELLALAGCWANVHFTGDEPTTTNVGFSSGRWLVIDEVGGLLVAAMAERMGLLYPPEDDEESSEHAFTQGDVAQPRQNGHPKKIRHPANDHEVELASSNTITLIHSNAQPNLSLLKYFSFTPDAPPSTPPHPLSNHLKPISWLQLLSPHLDTTYATPPTLVPAEQIASWKPGKRGTYYRKRRRYARTRSIVDETRAGGFDGLVVASYMDTVSIMKACVPLLRGGANIAIYSPTVEPLSQLADLYSMSRRTAFINSEPGDLLPSVPDMAESTTTSGAGTPNPNLNQTPSASDTANWPGTDDFPLNPTLLLGVTVQTSMVRKWQVLPGRTHPLMTGRGGAEGYLFTAVRVIPAEGKVAARGKFGAKRRRVDVGVGGVEGKTLDAREKIGGEIATGISGDGDGDGDGDAVAVALAIAVEEV